MGGSAAPRRRIDAGSVAALLGPVGASITAVAALRRSTKHRRIPRSGASRGSARRRSPARARRRSPRHRLAFRRGPSGVGSHESGL